MTDQDPTRDPATHRVPAPAPSGVELRDRPEEPETPTGLLTLTACFLGFTAATVAVFVPWVWRDHVETAQGRHSGIYHLMAHVGQVPTAVVLGIIALLFAIGVVDELHDLLLERRRTRART